MVFVHSKLGGIPTVAMAEKIQFEPHISYIFQKYFQNSAFSVNTYEVQKYMTQIVFQENSLERKFNKLDLR